MGLPTVISFVTGQSLFSPACINVTITDDDILEEKETFTVVLSAEFSGVSIARSHCIVEIIDSDSKGNQEWLMLSAEL